MIYAIDIETFSTSPGAVLVSVGIAREDGATWYWRLMHNVMSDGTRDPKWFSQNEREVDPSTIQWWHEKASPEARAEALELDGQVGLFVLCLELRDLFEACPATEIWARGSMDQAVLENVFKQCNPDQPFPWRYSVWRDERTLSDTIWKLTGIESLKAGAHIAVDDAIICLKNALSGQIRIKRALAAEDLADVDVVDLARHLTHGVNLPLPQAWKYKTFVETRGCKTCGKIGCTECLFSHEVHSGNDHELGDDTAFKTMYQAQAQQGDQPIPRFENYAGQPGPWDHPMTTLEAFDAAGGNMESEHHKKLSDLAKDLVVPWKKDLKP
jgi:hypothetical protein